VRYAYDAEWDDPVSGTKMAFTLLHWPHSSEVELVSTLPHRMCQLEVLQVQGVTSPTCKDPSETAAAR
jgi:hypothetical protein